MIAPRSLRLPQKLRLIALGGFLGLVLIELGVRLLSGAFWQASDPEESYGISDPTVGWIPRPGASMHDPRTGVTVSIGEHGTRETGATSPPSGRPLTLAVGDSFTFGDDVSDRDAWPAVLEQILGTRVVNAGVPGFGIDQSVLRAEQLQPVFHADTLILSFIPHDVQRCQMSYFTRHPKPFFTLDGSGLRFHPAADPEPPRLAGLRRLLAASLALRRMFPAELAWPRPLQVHGDGPEVACRLMGRLARMNSADSLRIVVLAQPEAAEGTSEDLALKDTVVRCARENGLPVLDLFPLIAAMPPARRAALFERHMTAVGNRFVAGQLREFLRGGTSLLGLGERLEVAPEGARPKVVARHD